RLLSKKVDVVALAMEDATRYINGAKRIEITGNPLRPELFKTNKKEAKEKLGLDERQVILVFGGSLGATYFNEEVISWIASLEDKNKYQIIMSAGKNNQYERAVKLLEEKGVDLNKFKNIRVSEYIYDMASALNACDLIIGRSGSSVSEMAALKKPAILVPSPNVAGNHQEFNARFIEKNGAAKVILEKDLNKDSLGKAVEEILGSNSTYSKMVKGTEKVGILDATDKLYKIAKELTEK
ncbi:MAG: UDP-N-acetylglucosamine--N-acetylmuramyl-(pentapeptide) pyrophosphoryl-undecaprenol N-acetylglucosamine transferase, partial [Clostridia bacterium]|nr:UDP-N-acetylglucosamine--N-acetylmuramyl-(pentapeptide) pyrophosphoryl-undecaprenol N-acetylglucosamine transferase [Clostridia bacterium]